MKIWIKILIGIVLGLVLGILLPTSDGNLKLINLLAEIFLRIGRYLVFPLAFFSLVLGTFELKREKKLLRVYARSLLYLLASAFLLVVIGILSVMIFSPERIPIIIEAEPALALPSLQEMVFAVFPRNLFQVLVGSGEILLPLMVLAFLLGTNLTFDLRTTSPVTQLADSLNRIFYHINSLLAELFGFALVAISAAFLMQLRGTDLRLFKQVLIILSIDCALVIFAVYPGLLYLLGEKENPYKRLYALAAPALVAFFTGDEYLSLGLLLKHGRENLGVPRRVGSAVYPLFAFFGRAGTALVAGVSFLLILKSYSSLEISFFQILWTLGFTLLISLTLGSVPGAGAFTAVAALCALFGKGLQEGYLILRPVVPLMISVGVLLDVVTSGLVSWLVARKEGVLEEPEAADFV
jgi:aerobic C4-dicarboxylate transport protein